jgi:hypothetical protein
MKQGFTFISNTPGLDSCRPDRILYMNHPCVSPLRAAISDGSEVTSKSDYSRNFWKAVHKYEILYNALLSASLPPLLLSSYHLYAPRYSYSITSKAILKECFNSMKSTCKQVNYNMFFRECVW